VISKLQATTSRRSKISSPSSEPDVPLRMHEDVWEQVDERLLQLHRVLAVAEDVRESEFGAVEESDPGLRDEMVPTSCFYVAHEDGGREALDVAGEGSKRRSSDGLDRRARRSRALESDDHGEEDEREESNEG
jgi:hypothetical protein